MQQYWEFSLNDYFSKKEFAFTFASSITKQKACYCVIHIIALICNLIKCN